MAGQSDDVLEALVQSNPKLANVKSSFDAIDKDGDTMVLTGGPDYSRLSESHLQGSAVYFNTLIVAMNRHGEDLGELYFYSRSTNALLGMMRIPVAGNNTSNHDLSYNHPGGIQVIGDYLLIPIQTQDYKKSVVQLWDVSPLRSGNLNVQPVHGDYLPASNGIGIGGIGIANMGSYFLAAAIDNDKVYFYKSAGADIATATYSLLFEAKLAREASEVNLIVQSDGTAFILAFCVSTFFQTYKDYGLLYKVDLSAKKITDKDERHFISHADSGTILGPHFRWGATSWYPNANSLGIMTTQRVMQPKVQLEIWNA